MAELGWAEPGATPWLTHLYRDVHQAELAVEVRRGAKEQADDGQQ